MALDTSRGPEESEDSARARRVRHRESRRFPRERVVAGGLDCETGRRPVISQRARERRIVEKLRSGILLPATPADILHPRSGGDDRCHGCDESGGGFARRGESLAFPLRPLLAGAERVRAGAALLGGLGRPERHPRASAMDDRRARGPAGRVRGAPAKLRGVRLGPGGGGPPPRGATPERRRRRRGPSAAAAGAGVRTGCRCKCPRFGWPIGERASRSTRPPVRSRAGASSAG